VFYGLENYLTPPGRIIPKRALTNSLFLTPFFLSLMIWIKAQTVPNWKLIQDFVKYLQCTDIIYYFQKAANNLFCHHFPEALTSPEMIALIVLLLTIFVSFVVPGGSGDVCWTRHLAVGGK
jgi:hypothetical protein